MQCIGPVAWLEHRRRGCRRPVLRAESRRGFTQHDLEAGKGASTEGSRLELEVFGASLFQSDKETAQRVALTLVQHL